MSNQTQHYILILNYFTFQPTQNPNIHPSSTIISLKTHKFKKYIFKTSKHSPRASNPGIQPYTWTVQAGRVIAASEDGVQSARVCPLSRVCCASCSRGARCPGSVPSAPPATGLYGRAVVSPLVACLPAQKKKNEIWLYSFPSETHDTRWC